MDPSPLALAFLDEQIERLENIADPAHPEYEDLRDQVAELVFLRDEVQGKKRLESLDEDTLWQLFVYVEADVLFKEAAGVTVEEDQEYQKLVDLYDWLDYFFAGDDSTDH